MNQNQLNDATEPRSIDQRRSCSALLSLDEALALFDRTKAMARIDASELQADRLALLAVYRRMSPNVQEEQQPK